MNEEKICFAKDADLEEMIGDGKESNSFTAMYHRLLCAKIDNLESQAGLVVKEAYMQRYGELLQKYPHTKSTKNDPFKSLECEIDILLARLDGRKILR